MEFYEHLKCYLSDSEIDKLSHSLREKPINGVLLNPSKIDKETMKELFPSLKEHPFIENAFIYDKETEQLSKDIHYELGCYYLQDPSAMLVASLLPISANDTILDLCSAPGGKTVGVSQRCDSTNLVISNDIAYSRLLAVIDNSSKLGLKNVVITHNDFSKNDLYKNFITYFDCVVVDAPCSGSGMVRKEPKMMSDWSYNKVLKYAEIQKELITMAFSMVKEGGYLMYSTCSFSYEEDEAVIEYLLDNCKDAEISELPKSDLFYTCSKHPYGIHLFPYLYPGEGQYLCLIHKKGERKESNIDTSISRESVMYHNIYPENPLSHYLVFKNSLYTLPRGLDNKLNRLNIIYPGVMIGEIVNNKVNKLDYHYARILTDYPKKIEISKEDTLSYISGHPLDNKKEGVYLLTYNGLAVSFTKGDGRILKNWYPKANKHN